jgi:small subunit ribosomal protein S17
MADCNDPRCPVHGHLKTRGRAFVGEVTSDKMQKSITIEMERAFLIKKYSRYEKRYTKIKAHNPACINAKTGQTVEIFECRPISKTKAFVVTKIIGETKHEIK